MHWPVRLNLLELEIWFVPHYVAARKATTSLGIQLNAFTYVEALNLDAREFSMQVRRTFSEIQILNDMIGKFLKLLKVL